MTKNIKNNSKFDHRLQNLPDAIWSIIAKIDQLQGQWVAGAKLNPQLLGRLKRSVLITSTGASTRIEGARLSDKDVEKMIKGLSIQKFADRDKQEVRGYYEILENIFNAWQKLHLNTSTVKHMHSELLKYADKDELHRGEYKKKENKVAMVMPNGDIGPIIFDTTDAYMTPSEMQELLDWTNFAFEEGKYHNLLIIANFIVEFLKIHPFEDGNGRLSRVLTNMLLLKAGYEYVPYVSHEKLIENNKPEYYLALRNSQNTLNSKDETIMPWLEFFFSLFLEQSQMAIELLSKENIEKILSPKQLLVWNYVQENSGTSVSDIADGTSVARATVRQAVEVLLKLKKIERLGQGRATRYKVFG